MNIEEKIKEIKTNEKGMNKLKDSLLSEFFSLLLGAKLIGHIHHFKTTGKSSYAKHKALDEFYSEANDIADKIIEVYQGNQKELVCFDKEDLVYGLEEETLEYLNTLYQTIEDCRKHDKLKASNIQNEIDNFLSLIDQTVYKLTFLE